MREPRDSGRGDGSGPAIATAAAAPTREQRKLHHAQLKAQAIRLYVSTSRRMTFRALADELGCSTATAFRLIKDVESDLARQTVRDASVHRARELERLDLLIEALWDRATGGEPTAIDRVARLIGQRCRLIGIDGPRRRAPGGADTAASEPAAAEEESLDLGRLSSDELDAFRDALLKAAGDAGDAAPGADADREDR